VFQLVVCSLGLYDDLGGVLSEQWKQMVVLVLGVRFEHR
jgi:hypothetical protein